MSKYGTIPASSSPPPAGASSSTYPLDFISRAKARGASALAATLHGAALLLRVGRGWDWFVHLDAADYPLVTPDGDSSLQLLPSFQIVGRFDKSRCITFVMHQT